MGHYKRAARFGQPPDQRSGMLLSSRQWLLTLLSLLLLALLLPGSSCLWADDGPRLLVTVNNEFGFPARNLKAEDFKVKYKKEVRPVEAARYRTHDLLDVVLLLETSEIGAQLRGRIRHVAGLFIDGLSVKDQMAIVGYASAADLVQDFTSSKKRLKRAVSKLKYGNPPALLDAIYAVVDGAFEHAAGRRVVVVIGSGLDWRNRVERNEVLRLARRNAVSIFAISFAGDGALKKLSKQTAGDFYSGKELRQIQQLVKNILEAFRGHYELVLPGPPLDSGKLKVEVPRGEKLRISFRIGR